MRRSWTAISFLAMFANLIQIGLTGSPRVLLAAGHAPSEAWLTVRLDFGAPAFRFPADRDVEDRGFFQESEVSFMNFLPSFVPQAWILVVADLVTERARAVDGQTRLKWL
jgi:hypothetical protein